MAKRHKVAVYGALMEGERNALWAANARGRRPCTLRGTLYDTGCGHPAFVPDNAGGYVDVVKSYPIFIGCGVGVSPATVGKSSSKRYITKILLVLTTREQLSQEK